MRPELQELAPEIEPLVRGIIRRKLRVTLDPSDGRRENQNALELFGDVWVKLLREPSGDGIRNLRSYAAVITYHACSEYFREKYPARSSLRNRAHYFLTHHPSYAVWDNEGESVCGFALWLGKPPDAAAADPLSGFNPGSAAKAVERMTPADWDALFDAIFETVGSPLTLDYLVGAIAPMVGSVDAQEAEGDREDEEDELSRAPSPDLSAEGQLRIRLQLQKLWIEILDLAPRQRLAYLLNPTDGEIDVFPANGIVTIVRIGRALAFTDEQFKLMAGELNLQSAGTYDEKFAAVWNRLPLNDKLIAKLLEGHPAAGNQPEKSRSRTFGAADERFSVICAPVLRLS